MSKSYKLVNEESLLGEAVSSAYSDIDELATECDDASNNFPNSSHPKAEAFAEAASTLQSYSEPDLPDSLKEVRIHYSVSVHRSKKASPSRAVRLENALAVLEAAVAAIDELVEEASGEEDTSSIESFKDDLQSTIDECQGVEFPGMFG